MTPKIETWRFVRRIYVRVFLVAIPSWIVIALVHGSVWLWIVFGISAVTWLRGFISVDRRISWVVVWCSLQFRSRSSPRSSAFAEWVSAPMET